MTWKSFGSALGKVLLQVGKNAVSDPKTSVAGVALIVGGVKGFKGNPDLGCTQIATGVGLLFAKDSVGSPATAPAPAAATATAPAATAAVPSAPQAAK